MQRSLITETKIDLLSEGVGFEPPSMFTDLPDITDYKTKPLTTQPTRVAGQVFDLSLERNVVPAEVLLRDGENESLTKLRYNPNSRLSIEAGDEGLRLFTGRLALDLAVDLVRREEILGHSTPVEANGRLTKVGDFIDIVGRNRVTVLLFDGCNNWNIGKPCGFCDLHPRRETDLVARPTTNTLRSFEGNTEKWWEGSQGNFLAGVEYSMREIDRDPRFNSGDLYFMAGNLPQGSETWAIAKEVIGSLSERFDLSRYNTILNIAPHDTIESLAEVKACGIKQVQYNLEVIGEDLFAKTCPGKINYGAFVAKLKEAVNVFGSGNVRSNFVFGLQDESEILRGIEELAEHGIVADYSVFQPKRKTPLHDHSAPSQAEVLRFTDRLVDIYLKHGFSPIFSTVNSRSSVINEVYRDRTCRTVQG